MALQAGQPFGNYRLVRLIGEGGFGEVYLVENPLIGRQAAVKVLHTALAQDPELVRRFLNEARAASAIHHPNIVEVFDAGGTPEGAPYILMEFLEGVSLQKRLADRGRLALAQALEIARQAGSALAAAHASGIVHRDLKPENLFLLPDPDAPGGERVKILDFGIAKIKGGTGTGGTVRTQTGFIMGSPAYMSPEQCKDSADVDLRSDIYSFATILYETLAGRTPHVAASGTELLIMHLTETPRPLRELAADVPAHVEAAIMRALARTRDDRFESMAAFLGALRGDSLAVASSQASPAKDSPEARPRPKSTVEKTALPPATVAAANSADVVMSGVERTAKLPADTTFSRATGEVGAAGESDETLPVESPPRRWPLFGVGGMVVAGLALLLALRFSRDANQYPKTNTLRVTATNTVISTGFPQPDPPRDAGVPPNRADSGAATKVVSGVQTGTKTALHTKTRTTASTKTKIDSSTKTKTDSGTKTKTEWDPFRDPSR